MAATIMGILWEIILKAREYMFGQMAEDLMENGVIIRCMVMGSLLGGMEGIYICIYLENMMGIMLMIRRKAMGNSFGLMAGNTRGIGRMENKMVGEFIRDLIVVSRKENGLMGNCLDG